MESNQSQESLQLVDYSPVLATNLKRASLVLRKPSFAVSEIKIQTVMVPMRDGVKLATDLYLPPVLPAPAVVMRTPYDRAADETVKVFLYFARRGYVAVSQDCRGTGGSEPDFWSYYLNEPEDGYDLVDWITKQSWYDGFIGSAGGSYVGQTQWQMAMHPKMTTIVPEVSGLGVAINTAHLHMFVNAYSKSMGHGDKIDIPYFELEGRMVKETLATGYYNEPLHKPFSEALVNRFPNIRTMPPEEAKRWLWEYYCSLSCAARIDFVKQAMGVKEVTIMEVEALTSIFGHQISHDRHTLPHPRMDELVKSLHASVLFSTGWYDWGLNDALATWELLKRSAPEHIRSNSRIFIAPSAHNASGYHEEMASHQELLHAHRFTTNFEFLLSWYDAARQGKIGAWPRVIYYLMGANDWRVASDWPIPEARPASFYLGADSTLSTTPPKSSKADQYTYDPNDPTPTMGGSIVSYVYAPGSVDVSGVQKRPDVLSYSSASLDHDLDVVGPLTLTLYASSSALDTDFVGRLSDVFPDGRAIQLQQTILRARYRNVHGDPELLEPGKIYKFEIDMWATANRFKAGHRLRVDISSADFPHFDRNTNLGGAPGSPVRALQTVYHAPEHPSHLRVSVLN